MLLGSFDLSVFLKLLSNLDITFPHRHVLQGHRVMRRPRVRQNQYRPNGSMRVQCRHGALPDRSANYSSVPDPVSASKVAVGSLLGLDKAVVVHGAIVDGRIHFPRCGATDNIWGEKIPTLYVEGCAMLRRLVQ